MEESLRVSSGDDAYEWLVAALAHVLRKGTVSQRSAVVYSSRAIRFHESPALAYEVHGVASKALANVGEMFTSLNKAIEMNPNFAFGMIFLLSCLVCVSLIFFLFQHITIVLWH